MSANNQNLILLAALGAGAYLLMTRRASAAPGTAQPGGQQVAAADPLAQLVNIGKSLFGLAGSIPGQTPVTTPGTGSRGTAETATRPYVPFEDAFPVNPVFEAPYEWTQDNIDYGQYF